MANRRQEQVRYRRLRIDPVLSDGLVSVDHGNGAPEAAVARAFSALAGMAGQEADRLAAKEGAEAAETDARGRARNAVIGSDPFTEEAVALAAPADTVPAAAASSARIPGGKATNRAAAARDYLIRRHKLPGHVAAAISGHGVQESGMRPTGAVGDAGTAFGLFQWRNERFDALKAFASKTGRSWENFYTQLDFVVHELNTTEKRAADALSSARNVEEAVAAFMHFERPAGWTPDTPEKGHGFANRLAFARQLTGTDATVTASADKSVAAPSVTPVTVTVQSGGGSTFVPSGQDTIRGRAYDAAGMKTYLQELDVAMSEDIARVAELYADNPAGLAEGFAALEKVHLNDHVFDEIAPQFRADFFRRTQPYLKAAEKRAATQREQVNRANFLDRTTALEEQQARSLALIDRDDEGSAAAALASTRALVDHLQTGVRNGVLTQEQADRYSRQAKNSHAVTFYGSQADGMSAEEVAGLREKMREDFGKGRLDGIDADGWSSLDAALKRQEGTARTRERQATRALTQRADQLVKKSKAGYPVPDAELTRLRLDANTAPEGEAIVDRTVRQIGIIDQLRQQNVTDNRSVLRQLEDKAKASGDQNAIEDYQLARDVVSARLDGLTRDPLAFAETEGVIGQTPSLIDAIGEDPSSALQERILQAQTVADHYGVPVRYLKAGEAAAVRDLLDTDPAAGAMLAGAIVEQGELAILQEFGSDAPQILQAGAILAGGGSAEAARDVIGGYAKGPDGRSLPRMTASVESPVITETIGAGFADQPQSGQRIIEAARAMTRTRLARQGIDPKSDEAKEVLSRSLQEAAGAVFDKGAQYGGIVPVSRTLAGDWLASDMQVYVPNVIRADLFGDVIATITDEDLAALPAPPVAASGKPYTARDIRDAVPVAVRGGYRFYMGGMEAGAPLRGADGQPFVLDIVSLKDRLQPRLPEAWR